MAVVLFRQQKQILRSNKELADKNEKIIVQSDAIKNQAIELRKLNQDLTDLNKNLETRILERTQQLYLQNQKLTNYTFVSAHKLRAPVATILGLINLLGRIPDHEIPEALGHLKNCGEQLDLVIRDLGADLEDGIIDSKD
jgi:signal transduction histidine kinase